MIWAFRQTSYIMYKRKKVSLSSDFLTMHDTIMQWNNIFKIFKQRKLRQYFLFIQAG